MDTARTYQTTSPRGLDHQLPAVRLFTEFASTRFQRRMRRIERARGQTLAEVLGGGEDGDGED